MWTRAFTTARKALRSQAASVETNLETSLYRSVLNDVYHVNEKYKAVKQGLENVAAIDRALGFPSRKVPVVHVTGTNGKGTVCFKVAKALEAAGLRTGLFTSPHISCFRERITVNGALISEEDVVRQLVSIMELAHERNIPATFFEFTTALAFSHFAQQSCDVVVLEVGLGGRLDSTNIVQNPLLTIITSIGLEHCRVLGDTREAIATEKAGIAKRGTPMLIGPTVPVPVVKQICDQVGAPLHVLPLLENETEDEYESINTRMAETTLQLLGHDLTESQHQALRGRPACRFQVVDLVKEENKLFILDVAHNEQALGSLFRRFQNEFGDLQSKFSESNKDLRRPSINLILALSSDKDVDGCMKALHKNGSVLDNIFFSRAQTVRAQDPEVMEESWSRVASKGEPLRQPKVRVSDSISSAIQLIRSEELSPRSITIVCGSIFMMTEARKCLGLEYPVDPEGISHKGAEPKNISTNTSKL